MRLTETLRNAIRNRMLTHRFSEERAAIERESAQLAWDVYCDVYSDSQRRKMRSLPKGWLDEEDSFQVKFGTTFTELTLASPKPMPADARGYRRAVKVYPATHPLSKRHDALSRRRSEMRDSELAARRQITAALSSVTTIKRLHEIWPESKQFTKDLAPGPANLPAVPIKQLNKLLNITAD